MAAHTTGLCRVTTELRIHAFIRNRYKNKQVQICQFYEWAKAHAYENVGQFYSHSFYATHFKTLNHCEESIKLFFLSKPTETLLNFGNQFSN